MPPRMTAAALDDFQPLWQELCVSMEALDISAKAGSGLNSDGLADNDSHSLGFHLS